jgi:AraC-like DNA-binding protein
MRDLQSVKTNLYADLKEHPKCTLAGQYTIVQNRYVPQDLWAFQILFQPGALYRLTGIPSYELTNTFIDAEAIWGREIAQVQEQLCNLEEIDDCVKVAEQFLEKIIKKSKRDLVGVDKIGQLILYQNQQISVDHLASQACLSPRQFYRKFNQRMGIGPKSFDKIKRLEMAYKLKNANLKVDWLTIALKLGYYDYQHLVHDFKEFTNLTPNGFLHLDGRSPESTFGVLETDNFNIEI